jgi:hypothetical protein
MADDHDTLLADMIASYGPCIHRWNVGEHLGKPLSVLKYPDETYRFAHTCDRGDRGVIRCAPLLSLHTISTPDEGLNISPSILCSDCGIHGFVRNSEWVSA